MKILVYIVTYKKNDILNLNLKSLWASITDPSEVSVTVLANHPEIFIDQENIRPNLRVVHNATRMPHAWGYLSRDWNFCILDAFKTWENPNSVDWLVLAQNDVIWVNGWDQTVRNNSQFDFISQPTGDQALVLNINAVRKIGFFDERFTTLHFQEIDYFIRSLRAIPSRVSITDTHPMHNYTHQPIGSVIVKNTFSGCAQDETLHNSSNMLAAKSMLIAKHGKHVMSNSAKNVIAKKLLASEINWYPFFWRGYGEIEDTFFCETRTKTEQQKLDFFLRMRSLLFRIIFPSANLRSKIKLFFLKIRKPHD